jgi:hypothetical protein
LPSVAERAKITADHLKYPKYQGRAAKVLWNVAMAALQQPHNSIQVVAYGGVGGGQGTPGDIAAHHAAIAGVHDFGRHARGKCGAGRRQFMKPQNAVFWQVAAKARNKALLLPIGHQEIAIGHATGQGLDVNGAREAR